MRVHRQLLGSKSTQCSIDKIGVDAKGKCRSIASRYCHRLRAIAPHRSDLRYFLLRW